MTLSSRGLRVLLLILVAAIVVPNLVCALKGRQVTLVVGNAPVEVWEMPSRERVIATLKPGDRVAVLRCEDLKHYVFVPVVRLPEGRIGYAFGQYRLVQDRPWSCFSGGLSFTCP